MKKTIRLTIISVLLFLCIKSYAQFSPVWNAVYQHTPSLNFSNESRKVVTDAFGNVFVLADVTSDIDPFGIFTANTYHYTVLLKYDASGNLVDDETLYVVNHIASGFDNKGAFGLELDSAGNVYVGFTTFSLFNSFDANIVKYDNNLTQIWYYQFKPPSQDFGVDMKVSQSGTAYAIARSVSGTDTTYHILSANSSGLTTTPFYSFDMNLDVLSSLVVDVNENVYVTGYQTISGYKAVLTAKVNASGNLSWKHTYNGGSSNRDDIGVNLTIGVDGCLYVTGISDQGAPSNNDIILMKHSTVSGKIYWTKFLDYNSGNDQGYFVDAPDVNYVYVGSVSSNSVLIDRVQTLTGDGSGRAVYEPDPLEPHSSLNGVSLVDFKISPNLNFYITGTVLATDLSAQTFSAAFLAKYILSSGSRGSFRLDFENPVYGDFNQSYDAAGLALNNLNEDVYWLCDAYLDYASHQTEAVLLFNYDVPIPFKNGNQDEEIINTHDGIIIYPVFAQNSVSIASIYTISRIELFDLAGKMVKVVTGEKNNKKIDIDNLLSGVYIVRIYSDTGKITNRKIVKD